MSARGRRWMGQVAVDGDRLVALAECGWDPANPQSPALAVMVADAWQQRGLGRRVLRELVRRCLSAGLVVFNLDYVASNATLGTLVGSLTSNTRHRGGCDLVHRRLVAPD
ncbi:GNAT family N-acetyltransferase [Micromonospora profundi]|uniref:GNAT family N-acetyltransferase n=1 Tax=Micromonospora profundi TaxID=1420889 RepID=UPI0035E40B65